MIALETAINCKLIGPLQSRSVQSSPVRLDVDREAFAPVRDKLWAR